MSYSRAWDGFLFCCSSSSVLSLHQYVCLKHVRTPEHRALLLTSSIMIWRASFSQLVVSKLVVLRYISGLFRSWTTETPITKSESCCVRSNFFRMSWTYILHLLTSPIGDVVEHAREDDLVRKALRCVRDLREESLQLFFSICTDSSPRHTCHSMSIGSPAVSFLFLQLSLFMTSSSFCSPVTEALPES